MNLILLDLVALWRWHLNLIVEYWLDNWDWCFIPMIVSWINLHPLNWESLIWYHFVSFRGLTYDFLDSFICFDYVFFISPLLFVSFMHLSITWFWAYAWQGLKEMVKVKVFDDKGKIGRISKSFFNIRETWEMIICIEGCLLYRIQVVPWTIFV